MVDMKGVGEVRFRIACPDCLATCGDVAEFGERDEAERWREGVEGEKCANCGYSGKFAIVRADSDQ